jgi:pimeloyl-ACP methyl ester carboxylesterase
MSEALIRGIHINYEIVGNSGPWVALTPGSRRSYQELIGIARDISASGFRVLLHDRRNCGASDVAFDGSASEHEVWADDLYYLCAQLNALPLYVGGSSAGARLAILFAIRHPEAVRGLLLWRVTGGKEAVNRLAEAYYGQFIKIAQSGGMQAVCESEHFSECIAGRASNRERLLQTDVLEFVKVMTFWRERFLESASLPIVGATEHDLKAITVPACVIAGNDVIHTPSTARKIAHIIQGSELHDDVVSKRADNELLDDWDRLEWRHQESRMVQIFTAFMKRHENSRKIGDTASHV